MKTAAIALLAIVGLSAAVVPETFTGAISDDMCATAGHAPMQMGPTDGDCTKACVSAHGAAYVLHDGKDVYTLSGGPTPEQFAGQKVKVVGVLEAKTHTIQVASITLAE